MGNSSTTNKGNFGFRILSVNENAPAQNRHLRPYTDFVVDIKEKPENFQLDRDFYKFVIANEDKEVHFIFYNILDRKRRVERISLSRQWKDADFLLGFKIRYESIDLAQQNMYRVLKVTNPELSSRIQEKNYFFLAVKEFIFDNLADFKERILVYR